MCSQDIEYCLFYSALLSSLCQRDCNWITYCIFIVSLGSFWAVVRLFVPGWRSCAGRSRQSTCSWATTRHFSVSGQYPSGRLRDYSWVFHCSGTSTSADSALLWWFWYFTRVKIFWNDSILLWALRFSWFLPVIMSVFCWFMLPFAIFIGVAATIRHIKIVVVLKTEFSEGFCLAFLEKLCYFQYFVGR